MRLGLGLGLNRARRGGSAAGPTGILDSYTGAAFAFAPDTLIYSGFSVTDNTAGSNTNGSSGEFTVLVRRSSDNALQSFTWEEVGDGTLVTWVGAGNNGFVQKAYEQSGNDNHVSQTTAVNQPKIVDSGTLVVENGKAALDFDGINDVLFNSLNIVSGEDAPISSFSIIASSDYSTLQNIRSFADTEDFNPLSDLLITGNDLSYRKRSEDRTLKTTNAGITLVDNTQYLIADTSNGSVVNLAVNAALEINNGDVDVPTLGAMSASSFSIGARVSTNNTQFFVGKIQAIIIFGSDQSANRTAISTAINNEYSIY